MEALYYDVYTYQDIRVDGNENKLNFGYTKNYISGTSLRAMIIGRYLKKYPKINLSEDAYSRKIFLDGNVKFLNAYKNISGKGRTLPLAACSCGDNENTCFGFCDYKNGSAEKAEVFVSVRTHLNKHGGKNKIEKYDFIQAGQIFTGIILCENEEQVLLFTELLNNKEVYIGAGRGSGYGKCCIKNMKCISSYDEEIINVKPGTKTLYIKALSDILYFDEKGINRNVIKESFIEEKLGLKNVRLEKCILKGTIISGYNSMWKTHLPQYKGIRAGSIFKYSYEGNPDYEKIRNLAEQGIGQRRAEGYGCIGIYSSEIPKENITLYKEKQTGNEKSIEKSEFTTDEEKEMDFIFKNLLEAKLERLSGDYVNKILKESALKGAKNNQIGNMLIVIEEMLGKPKNEGIKDFEIYKSHLQANERINKAALNQLQKIKIKDENILAFSENIIKASENQEKFSKQYFQLPELKYAQKSAEVSKEILYKNSLKIIKNLLKSILKQRR